MSVIAETSQERKKRISREYDVKFNRRGRRVAWFLEDHSGARLAVDALAVVLFFFVLFGALSFSGALGPGGGIGWGPR